METYEKQNNRYQLCLLLFNNNVYLKNNKRNYRKIRFNLILMNHKITYDAVMKMTHSPPIPAYRY